jgi:hypothetical protein
MKSFRALCIALLAIASAVPIAPAQQPAGNSPSPSPAPAEKPRTAGETRKQLQKLACGPAGARLSHHAEKTPQPLPAQPADKGLIYVIRTDSMVGAAISARLAMDGQWVGVNRIGNYFYLEVDPGPHYFCADANSIGLLSLVIEKGNTYYLQQRLTMGGTDLDLIDAGKGKQYVAKYHKSTFEAKNSN